MGNLATAQTDIQKQWAFQAAGVNANQNVAQLLPQLLRKAGEVYKAGSTATAQQRLDVSGLSALGIDVETARRMASLRKDEIDNIEKKYNADTKSLALTDALLLRWQDLDVQLTRSKTKIENVFLTGLEGLVKPLDELSDSFSDAVKAFLESPKLKEWIGDVGKKLEEFAGYLKKDEFKQDVQDWLSMLNDLKDEFSGLLVLLKPFALLAPTNIQRGYEAAAKGDMFEASRRLPAGDFANLLLAQSNPQLKGVNPQLAATLISAGLGGEINSGFRTEKEEAALRHHIDPKTGKWVTKDGLPVTQPGETSHHTLGTAVDINNARKYSDEYLAQYGLYRPLGSKDPGHIELKNMLENQSSNNKGSGVPQSSSAPAGNYAGNLGSLNWNPTPISLSVNTTKIPGQDTNVDILKAGGYYTSIGLR